MAAVNDLGIDYAKQRLNPGGEVFHFEGDCPDPPGAFMRVLHGQSLLCGGFCVGAPGA